MRGSGAEPAPPPPPPCAGGPGLPPAQPGGVLALWGTLPALREAGLEGWLARCGRGVPAAPSGGAATTAVAVANSKGNAAHSSSSSGAGGGAGEGEGPDTAQRAAIAAARRWDPLPPGWTCDGSRFYDEFGDGFADHPHIDR